MKSQALTLPLFFIILAISAGPTQAAGTVEGAYEVIANALGFGVNIPGCPEAAKNIREISIDELNIDTREMTTGLDVEYRLYGPGATHWGQARFVIQGSGSESRTSADCLFEAAPNGKSIRKNITVTLFKKDRQPARSYEIEFTPSDLQKVPCPGRQDGCWEVKGFVGSVEFKSIPSQNPGGPQSDVDEILVSNGFKVEITGLAAGGKDVDTAWESVSGGELIIEQTETTIGSDRFQTTSPGHKTVGEITLRGAMTDKRRALLTWINETVAGKPWKRNLTVTELLSVDGGVKDGKQYTYHDCFPVGYRYPSFSTGSNSTLTESVVIKCERVSGTECRFCDLLRFPQCELINGSYGLSWKHD